MRTSVEKKMAQSIPPILPGAFTNGANHTLLYSTFSKCEKGEKNLKKMGNHNTLNRLKFWFSGMSFKSPINIKCMEYPQIA